MKKGLVLEGGAMRGMFTAGVIDTMMETGIEFDGLVGVSAGACFGCNYKSRQPGRAARYNIQYCRDPRYCGLRSLARSGDLFNAEFCYHTIPERLDPFDYEAFRQNPMEFHVVCTDVESGEALYFSLEHARDAEMDLIRASASMPLVSRIVEACGRRMLDGGIADSIPIRYFEGLGYDRNVVVLTQPEGYVKKINRLLPLMRHRLGNYPKLVDAIAHRHILYNETTDYIRRREAEGACFVIRPKAALDVRRVEHDPQKLRAAYEQGRAAMLEQMPALKRYLNEA